jgi:hypothetical protein
MSKNLLTLWQEAKKGVDEARAVELNLRNQILAQTLTKKEGSETTVFEGEKIRVTGVVNYTIDKTELETIYHMLTEEEKAAVRFKPELVVKNFKALPKHNILSTVITAKPGQGQLEVK